VTTANPRFKEKTFMKRGLALISLAVVAALGAVTVAGAKTSDTTLSGAGSTFVAPLVSTWTPALGSAFGYTVQYSAVGSGAGIAAITNRQVDFGASDAPMSTTQFTACNGCAQIPWALAATTVAYNVPGAPVHLRLNGATIANIFLGHITNWNDPAIAALNPGASLPNLKITPVFRSDGSGTSYNFSDYLSSVSPEWKTKIGVSTQPSFPAGVGAKGSGGVAGVVKNTPGGVTYVDVAYALVNHIRFAAVQNAAGKFLYPSIRRIIAAAQAFPTVGPNNEMHIVNPPKSAPLAYPICTYTYVIVPLQTAHAAELRKMIFWALTQGQSTKYTAKLIFAPLSSQKSILVAAEKTLKTIHT
jgi:phosphate transport system substrate-binding protein